MYGFTYFFHIQGRDQKCGLLGNFFCGMSKAGYDWSAQEHSLNDRQSETFCQRGVNNCTGFLNRSDKGASGTPWD
ncbi:hypothetical protein GCM10007872_12650 [Gluconobacter sphaericus NBRC 12467]|uniref:Uncharacterized protein n=1 Tax=Gluconobacter sphaericus NBRC 12467 TaxID=1307951 RepID=A0AA37SII6_9PROT|nr:hypothetical protein AA12467_0282 [Gluconobacter sphaericus NBRC 12467]GEB41687.1 hypothetical protein GSP01_04690 [Gluconobacter sphaericus NBRC 12467]GLQ84357.1 hypothetical protein GCM10007872_12650 [Gluconobacter sphaericus NBRC 12467]